MNDEHKVHHKVLASPPVSQLGQTQWHMLRASTPMHSQTTVTKPAGPNGKFARYEQTEFGKPLLGPKRCDHCRIDESAVLGPATERNVANSGSAAEKRAKLDPIRGLHSPLPHVVLFSIRQSVHRGAS